MPRSSLSPSSPFPLPRTWPSALARRLLPVTLFAPAWPIWGKMLVAAGFAAAGTWLFLRLPSLGGGRPRGLPPPRDQ